MPFGLVCNHKKNTKQLQHPEAQKIGQPHERRTLTRKSVLWLPMNHNELNLKASLNSAHPLCSRHLWHPCACRLRAQDCAQHRLLNSRVARSTLERSKSSWQISELRTNVKRELSQHITASFSQYVKRLDHRKSQGALLAIRTCLKFQFQVCLNSTNPRLEPDI